MQQSRPTQDLSNHVLDEHFRALYSYYERRGLLSIFLSEVTSTVNLASTICLTSLLMFLDWTAIRGCKTESTCASFSLRNYVLPLFEFTAIQRLLVISYISLAVGYFVRRSVASVSCVISAFSMHEFYHQHLGLTEASISSACLPWSEVLSRVKQLHATGRCLIHGKENSDELEISARIMRKDNFLISLINREILDLRVPWYFGLLLPSDKIHLTNGLHWCLRYCLLDSLFNEACHVRGSILQDGDELKRRFLFVGLLNFILLPFLVIHMVVQFFLSNAQQACVTDIFSREWSSLTKWRFREFNELPHFFERRMRIAQQAAKEYFELHSSIRNRNLSIVIRCIGYIAGSFVACLLFLSVLREEALLYISLGAHNLVWWLGLWTTIFLSCRGFTAASSSSPLPEMVWGDDEDGTSGLLMQLDRLLARVCSSTHYYPAVGTAADGGGKTRLEFHSRVREEMDCLCPQRFIVFGFELLSVILTPVILMFSLPSCVPAILAFIKEHAKNIEGMGSVVDYSLFPFDRCGDRAYGSQSKTGRTPGTASRGGKMEASYLSFTRQHPGWTPAGYGGGGAAAVPTKRLVAFREMKERGMKSSSVPFPFPAPFSSSLNHPAAPQQAALSLLSAFAQAEKIDFQNDHYWLNLFANDYARDPAGLEASLCLGGAGD